MRDMDLQRVKAVLLYILSNMPDDSRDIYHIVKTAFFAQKDHFVRYALPLFNDRIMALPFGPVPSLIYNILKVARGDNAPYRFCDRKTLDAVANDIVCEYESFSTKQAPDTKYLSKSNIECLDSAIATVSKMDFDELMDKTHGDEWLRAYHSANRLMNDINIAKEGGASEAHQLYLAEALELRGA